MVRDLSTEGPIAERLNALALHTVVLEPWEEIVDPGGGEVDDFIACAHEVVTLIDRIVDRLR